MGEWGRAGHREGSVCPSKNACVPDLGREPWGSLAAEHPGCSEGVPWGAVCGDVALEQPSHPSLPRAAQDRACPQGALPQLTHQQGWLLQLPAGRKSESQSGMQSHSRGERTRETQAVFRSGAREAFLRGPMVSSPWWHGAGAADTRVAGVAVSPHASLCMTTSASPVLIVHSAFIAKTLYSLKGYVPIK